MMQLKGGNKELSIYKQDVINQQKQMAEQLMDNHEKHIQAVEDQNK